MKLVIWDSIQNVHSSHEKELEILIFHKKFIFFSEISLNKNRSKYSPF